MTHSAKRIGIIGAGFTGTMLTVHLLHKSRSPIEIFLFDRAGAFGAGTPYSTPNAKHLLNVRVANMSAFDDDPKHFIRWLWSHERHAAFAPSGHAFVSRGTYGAYLRDLLEDAWHAADNRATLTREATEVCNLQVDDQRVRLHLGDRRDLELDCAVLCVGNFPPGLPGRIDVPDPAEPRYIGNPWDQPTLARIDRDEAVLLLGTGLTMIDVVLELVSLGHQGPLVALSRRGLLPHVHGETQPYHAFLSTDHMPRTASALFAQVRREAAQAAARGLDWRGVIDAMRPLMQPLWRGLPLSERKRFLRHIRPYWEIHRHRIAPQVAREIEALRRRGRLKIVAGRVADIRFGDDRVTITARRRQDGTPCRIEADWLINCSGPELDYSRIRDTLVQNLVSAGVVRPDPLALGLDVSNDFSVRSATGVPSSVLFALGPPIRGALWETTAVPDIRKQCEQLASRLAS